MNKSKLKILILCTGNSCRSQMAEGFLKSCGHGLLVYSAGTEPAGKVNPYAISVMKEEGIDISNNKPKHVDEFLPQEFDYVITVCDGAKESCPIFIGKVKKRLHIAFDDPSYVAGSEEFIISEFRRVRDEIKEKFTNLYVSVLQ